MTEEYKASYQLFLRALRRISWISGVGLAVSVLFLFYPDGRLFISTEGEGLNGCQTGRLICVGLASFGLLVAAVYRDFFRDFPQRSAREQAEQLDTAGRLSDRFQNELLGAAMLCPVVPVLELLISGTAHSLWGLILGEGFFLANWFVGMRPAFRALNAMRNDIGSAALPGCQIDPAAMEHLRRSSRKLLNTAWILVAAVIGLEMLSEVLPLADSPLGTSLAGGGSLIWIFLFDSSSGYIYYLFFFRSIATVGRTPEEIHRDLRGIQLSLRYGSRVGLVCFTVYFLICSLSVGRVFFPVKYLIALALWGLYRRYQLRYKAELDAVLAAA